MEIHKDRQTKSEEREQLRSSGDTEREREKKEKMRKNMKRATCSGRDLSAEKVCGLDFSP